MKLPRDCEFCGKQVMHYGRCECQQGVDESCNCIYCDLGLDPDIEVKGVKFHHVHRRGNILCTRRFEPKPMAAFRYDRLIGTP